MTDTYLPRRSVLYMPGANEKALEKAKGLATDAIIFDTEDSVAPDMKIEARARVAAAAASGEYGVRELTIRVNSLETEWFEDDVRSASEAGPSGIAPPPNRSLRKPPDGVVRAAAAYCGPQLFCASARRTERRWPSRSEPPGPRTRSSAVMV